jgi:hypothetical protein
LESLRRTISKADCSVVPWGVEIILPFAKKVGSLHTTWPRQHRK